MTDPAEAADAMLHAERDRLEAELDELAAEVAGLRETRSQLADVIAELKAFEREYRERLDAYLGDLRATLRMEGRL